jgi:hypothetical protein
MIDNPSRAQLLNLKRGEIDVALTARVQPPEMQDYPDQLANYEKCNASFADLLAFGSESSTNPSAACRALVALAFPARKATHPSGITNRIGEAAADSECYQDFLARVRLTADVCSDLWQKCGPLCVQMVPEASYGGAGCGGGVVLEGEGRPEEPLLAVVNSNVRLARSLLEKVLHLADVIFFLISGVKTSKRGLRCGTPWSELLLQIPQVCVCLRAGWGSGVGVLVFV